MKKNTKNAKNAAAKPTPEPSRYQVRRRELSDLSAELKAKNPDAGSVNGLLLSLYAERLGCAVFDTFEGWTKRGRAVKKGEKAVAVWKPAADGGKSNWLLEFLFAESQTTERRATAAAV